MTGVADLLAVAHSQLGITEKPAGTNRQKYGAAFGWNGVAWCAEFAWWCLEQIGAGDLIAKSASVEAVYRHAEAAGQVNLTPAVGALPVYDFGTPGKFDHIGACVVEVTGPWSFTAIEGNTSRDDRGSQSNGGGVFLRHRVLPQVAGFIHLPLEDTMAATAEEIATAVWLHAYNTGAGKPTESAQDRLVAAARGGGLTDDIAALAAKFDALAAGMRGPVNVTVDLDKLAAAVVKALPAGTTLTATDIAAAVCNEQARRLQA